MCPGMVGLWAAVVESLESVDQAGCISLSGIRRWFWLLCVRETWQSQGLHHDTLHERVGF